MKSGNRFTIADCLVKTDRLLLMLGIGLLGIYFGAHLHSWLFSHFALWRFEEVVAAAQRPPDQPSPSKDGVDVSRWAKARLKAYESSLVNKLPDPIAILTIPRLHLRVPIFDGTDEVTLNRGIGRIRWHRHAGQGWESRHRRSPRRILSRVEGHCNWRPG